MSFTHWLFLWLNPFGMPFDMYAYFLLDVCAFVLFVQALFLLRVLLLSRQPWWSFLFLVIPLGVSMWSFLVATQAWQVNTFFNGFIGTHFDAAFYEHLLMMRVKAAIACLFWVQVIIAVFTGMLLWEKKCLPRIERPPVWVLAREAMLRHQ